MDTSVFGLSQVTFAIDGIIFMAALLGGTYISWQALGVLKWEKFVFDPVGHQSRMLRFILSVICGFFLACVALVYVVASQAIRLLF